MNTIISPEAKRAIDLAYKEHWRFRVIGQGEIPQEPSYKDQWWFQPITEPEKGRDRIAALRRAGVPIKGLVIAHEAPRLLSAPKEPDFKTSSSIPASNKTTSDLVNTAAGELAGGLAVGLVLVLSLVFEAILIDPALIVVLEDGTWLEVLTWYEPTTL